MASTLPDFTALGAMPAPVSGRAIATPNTTAIGQGLQAFGRGISQLADSVQKGWAAQESANAQSAYLDFLGTQDQKYTAAVANLDPANAKGFAAGATTDYLTASKQFLDSLPAAQRQAYGDKVFQDYQAKSADALKVEQAQQTTFAKTTIAKSTDGLQRGILVDPTTYDSAVAAGDELIQMSALPPAEKQAELNTWHQNAAIMRFQAKAATDPQGALQEYEGFAAQQKANAASGTVGSPSDNAFPAGVAGTIDAAATAAGLDPSTMRTVALIESGGDPKAADPGNPNKGLFQLSSDIMQAGGGGDVMNAADNARAAAAELRRFSDDFSEKFGRAPSAAELYLMHQQGEAGGLALMANPTAPAWQAVRKFYGSDGVAQKAIWGNIPDDVKKQFPGGVTTVSAGDFSHLWATKVGQFGGGSATARAPLSAQDIADRTTPVGDRGYHGVRVLNSNGNAGQVTATRDRFGEWSVSDTNGAPPGSASPDQLEAQLAIQEKGAAGSYIANIPSDKILPLLSDASALAVRQQTALQQQQAAQAKAWNNAAENAVQDGTFGLTELDQAVKDRTLTDAVERKQLFDMITARDKDGVNLAAAQGKFSDTNYTFNPFDATDKKSVDSVYKAIGHNGAGLLTPPEPDIVGGAEGMVSRRSPGAPQLTDQDILVWTVKRTGIVPTAAVDKVQQGIYSPDRTSREQAFQVMDVLSQLDPGAYGRAFTAEDQKRLGVYQALAALVPPDELDKALAPKTPQGLKLAKSSSTSAGIDTQTFINAAGYQNGPTQPTDPVQIDALRTDYENAFAEAYASVHDESAATKLAAQWVAHKWGPTEVGNGGSVLTPYPPEKYYPTIGGDQHWMAAQLRDTVTAQAQDAKSWGVVPSPQTAVEAATPGVFPSYNVWYQDASGAFRMLPNPMRFDPKSAQAQAVEDFKAKHAAATAPPPPPSQLDIDHGTGAAAPPAPGENAVPAAPRTDYGAAPLFQSVPPGTEDNAAAATTLPGVPPAQAAPAQSAPSQLDIDHSTGAAAPAAPGTQESIDLLKGGHQTNSLPDTSRPGLGPQGAVTLVPGQRVTKLAAEGYGPPGVPSAETVQGVIGNTANAVWTFLKGDPKATVQDLINTHRGEPFGTKFPGGPGSVPTAVRDMTGKKLAAKWKQFFDVAPSGDLTPAMVLQAYANAQARQEKVGKRIETGPEAFTAFLENFGKITEAMGEIGSTANDHPKAH